jgi:preprotein translocase subunit YajC
MLQKILLLAQAPAEGAQSNPLTSFLLPLIPIAFLFWFLILRPQRKQEQERQSLLASMKKNDKVVTAGGLYGTVVSIKEKEDEVTLKVDENSNVRVRVTKGSIVRILSGEDSKDQKEEKSVAKA